MTKNISLIQYRDLKSVIETAVEEAVEEREFEIAKNLISLGSENDFIVKATGLTVEQIEQLRNETKKS